MRVQLIVASLLIGAAGPVVAQADSGSVPRAAPAAPPAADSGSGRIHLSGYVTSSYVYATNPTGRSITGRLYDRFHDQFEINAARVTAERVVATDKMDAGFRIDVLFGQNAPPLRSAGLSLGDQGDLPQAFVTLNLPTGAGTHLQLKAGKMWTLLDVEVVDEVLNPTFSHGYQYIYLTNFTATGVGIDGRFSAKVDAQLHVINGWDLVEDNNSRKSFMGRVGLALRADYMDDRDGARTSGVLGFAVAPRRRIGSGTMTLNVKTWHHVLLRPEVRVEHSNLPDFGDPADPRSTQATLAFAASYLL